MQIISKHRTALMGIAIAWTMLYHAQVHLPKSLAPLIALRSLGYMGVDIFFLLSGLGLSFSWKRHPHALPFLRKRLARIVPVFWWFVALCCLKEGLLEGRAFGMASAGSFLGLDFLLHGRLDHWFVPAILICYLLFLPLAYAIDRWDPWSPVVAGTCLAVAAAMAATDGPAAHLMIFLIRLPAFLLGVGIGHMLAYHRDSEVLTDRRLMAGTLTIALLAWCAMQVFSSAADNWRHGWWWYPTVVMAYPMSFFMAMALEHRNVPKAVHRALDFLGEHSLELYLTHAFIFSLAPWFPGKDAALNIGRWPEYLLYSAVAIALSPRVGRLFQRFRETTRPGRARAMAKAP